MSQATTILTAIVCEAIFLLLIVIVKSEITVQPDIYYNLSSTSRADNYVIQNQRQYKTDDWILEIYLSNFRKDYYGRIETIDYHVDLIELKLHELENKINPLVLLDDLHDYCLLKYRSQLPNLEAIKTSLATCKQKGKAACEPLIASAEKTRKNLKNYYANQFANQLKDCRKKFADLASNYTTCMVAAVKSTNAATTSNKNTFHNQLNQAKCSAVLKVKQTFDCYATVVGDAYSSVGKVMGLVESCMESRKFLPPGAKNIPDARCPFQLSWHLTDADMISAKINNPFKGVNKSTPCLQINFITEGVTKT